MVVGAIISLLLSILLPVYGSARKYARNVGYNQNMDNLKKALELYVSRTSPTANLESAIPRRKVIANSEWANFQNVIMPWIYQNGALSNELIQDTSIVQTVADNPAEIDSRHPGMRQKMLIDPDYAPVTNWPSGWPANYPGGDFGMAGEHIWINNWLDWAEGNLYRIHDDVLISIGRRGEDKTWQTFNRNTGFVVEDELGRDGDIFVVYMKGSGWVRLKQTLKH